MIFREKVTPYVPTKVAPEGLRPVWHGVPREADWQSANIGVFVAESKRLPEDYIKAKVIRGCICFTSPNASDDGFVRWRNDSGDGYLITTYPTDAIKEGVQIWHK